MVANAMPSVKSGMWLFGDMFSYVCNGDLVLLGFAENMCDLVGNSAAWSLSMSRNNLPTCGKLAVDLAR